MAIIISCRVILGKNFPFCDRISIVIPDGNSTYKFSALQFMWYEVIEITSFFSGGIFECVVHIKNSKWSNLSEPAVSLNCIEINYKDPVKSLETALREIIFSILGSSPWSLTNLLTFGLIPSLPYVNVISIFQTLWNNST